MNHNFAFFLKNVSFKDKDCTLTKEGNSLETQEIGIFLWFQNKSKRYDLSLKTPYSY